jgi:DNA-binding beta-propeller fold protein YncE
MNPSDLNSWYQNRPIDRRVEAARSGCRSRARWPRAIACALVAGALSACGQRALEPWDGQAFPNQRPRVAWPDAGGAAVTSDNGSDTITVVSLADHRALGTYPIGIDPVAIDGPHHLAIDPARRVLFTAYAYPPPALSPGPHGNHGASNQLGVLVARSLDDLRVLGRADVESNPGDILLTPDRTRIAVTHFELSRVLQWDGGLPPPDGGSDPRASAVTLHDARTLQRIATARPCMAAHGGAITPNGRWLLVACNGEDSIAVLDLQSSALASRRFPVGPGASSLPDVRYGPYSITIAPDGRTGYAANLEGRDVREFRIDDDGALAFDSARSVRVNGAAFFSAIGPDGSTLIVPTQSPDQLVLVDRATMTVRRARAMPAAECKLPHQINRSPDGRYFLVCEGIHGPLRQEPGALLAIDPETLETRARVPAGIYPDAVEFVP